MTSFQYSFFRFQFAPYTRSRPFLREQSSRENDAEHFETGDFSPAAFCGKSQRCSWKKSQKLCQESTSLGKMIVLVVFRLANSGFFAFDQ